MSYKYALYRSFLGMIISATFIGCASQVPDPGSIAIELRFRPKSPESVMSDLLHTPGPRLSVSGGSAMFSDAKEITVTVGQSAKGEAMKYIQETMLKYKITDWSYRIFDSSGVEIEVGP